jgi:hypothetical protein
MGPGLGPGLGIARVGGRAGVAGAHGELLRVWIGIERADEHTRGRQDSGTDGHSKISSVLPGPGC